MTQVEGQAAMSAENSNGSGLVRRLLVVFLALLAAGSALTAASTARAAGCEGSSCSGFTQDEFEVVEAAAYAQLWVSVAWCCPVAQGAIDYETFDLTAVAGQDYQRTSGTLTFTGHGGNVIRVPITHDQLHEGEELFEVRLTNFRGSFVNRGRESANVRILEESPGTSAPSDRSSQQTTGSQTGSSARPPSQPSAGSVSSSSADASNQSSEANANDAILVVEPRAGEETDGKSGRHENRPSSLSSLGTLLLLIAAAGIALKKRHGGKAHEDAR